MEPLGLEVRNVAHGLDIEVELCGAVDHERVVALVQRLTTLASRQPRQLRLDLVAATVEEDALVSLAAALVDLGSAVEAEGGRLVVEWPPAGPAEPLLTPTAPS